MSRLMEQLESRRLMAVADGFESDNTLATARTIAVDGAPQSHSIHVNADVDVVKFVLPSASAVVIETRTDGSTVGDTYLTLADANGNQIAVDDDGGNGLNSEIVRFGAQKLPAGTYYGLVKSYAQASTINSYTIRVQVTPDFGLSAYQDSNPFWVNRSVPKAIRNDSAIGNALGNCTWFAVGRSIELGAGTTVMNAFNGQLANNFDEAAKNKGIQVVQASNAALSDIRVGDIAQIDRTSQGVGGHVATIERVNRDSSGRITSLSISQSSYAGNSPQQGDSADYLYKRGTLSIGQVSNFLLVQPRNGSTPTPTAPTNVTWTRTQAGQIRMSWTNTWGRETGFDLQYRSGSSTWVTFGSVPAGTPSVLINAPAGSTYTLRVVAYDANNRLASNPVTVTF